MTERVIQALSAVSSIYLVELVPNDPDEPKAEPSYECRKCLVVSLLADQTVRCADRRAALEHLDLHARRSVTDQAGANGAKDAIAKLEMCRVCRGAGRVRRVMDFEPCAACGQTGKNEIARERMEARRARVS